MSKILIIEDDQLVAQIYRNKFAAENFAVEIAHDGQAGLEMITNARPDAVILDLMIPKIPGIDVLKRVRAQAEFKHLPVIVFSNTFLSNMVQEAWKAGATKCLSKANCTPKQVVDVVRSLLSAAPGAPAAAEAAPKANAPAAAPATAQPATPAPAKADVDDDDEFQAELRQSFVNSLPVTLSTLRVLLQALFKSPDEPSRARQLQELYRRIHALTGNAGIAGTADIAQISDALEALLKELCEKPASCNSSALRTIASAIDFLGALFEPAQLDAKPAPAPPPTNILVVDDEAISRRAVTYALEKAKLQSTSVDDPQAALDLLSHKPFDMVFLDVDMPGMTGYELCTKLRAIHAHKKTPVIFVTGLSDFESRAHSTMSGGNDLIAKPFIFMELAVKALVFYKRLRLAPVAA